MPSIWSNPSPKTSSFTNQPQNPGNVTPVPAFTINHGFNAFQSGQPPVIPAPQAKPARTLGQIFSNSKKSVTVSHY